MSTARPSPCAARLALSLLALLALPTRAINNGLGRVPMNGWATWCTDGPCFQDVCTEQEIKSVVLAMEANGLQAAGWNWIEFDDCWEDDKRSPSGDLQADSERFPSGMPAIVDFIHSHGFKFQIYTSLGHSTCSKSGRPLPLPGSYGHELQDAAWMAKLGVDGVKGDWCDAGGLNMEAVTTTFSSAINASGRAMFFNFHCDSEFSPWCAAQGTSSRVDHDHQDYWNRTGFGTKEILSHAATVSSHAGTQATGGFWFPDLDFLMTGGQGCVDNSTAHCPQQSDDEYVLEFTMWALVRSVLLFATDPRNMTAVMTKVLLNTELLAVNQAPCAMPGATLVTTAPCGSTEPCQVWATRPFCDTFSYIALVNAGDSDGASFALDFASLPGRSAATSGVVRDMWAHADLGHFAGAFPASGVSLRAHSAMALQLRAGTVTACQ